MVHIFCLNEKCRRILHLDDNKHWNYTGLVKCTKCGFDREVTITNGELTSAKKAYRMTARAN